jgi:hypothetical protein
MTTFSSATAAALESPDDTLKPGLYSYAVELEFTVKTNGQFAPSLVMKILAKLLLDEPDIAFVDSKRQRITVDEFPTSKADFDVVFSTTTTGGKLSCKFEIQSFRNSFHAIKIRAWDILHVNKVWCKRAPGPVKKNRTRHHRILAQHPPRICKPESFPLGNRTRPCHTVRKTPRNHRQI